MGERAHPQQRGEFGGAPPEVPLCAADIDERGVGRERLDHRGEVLDQAERQGLGREPYGEDHPALPWLECQSLRPVAFGSPAGLRSAQGFIS